MARKIITAAMLPLMAALLTEPPAAEYVVPSTSKTITMFGKPVEVEETSLKCGVKAIKGVSLLRLADCDSALEMKLPKSGISFIRFEVAPGDPQISQGWRAELRDMHVAKNGEEVWYRFSTLMPSTNALEIPHRVVTAQWHEEMPLGKLHKRPPLARRQVNGGFDVPALDLALGLW